MEKICFISSNKGKIEEIKRIMEKFGISLTYKKMELPESTSTNQNEVAKQKVRLAVEIMKQPVVVEDTGMYFEAYDNFPGPFPKFVFEGIGYEGIFKLLKNKSKKAYFRTIAVFEGICKGKIVTDIRGEPIKELPYDNIFIPEGDTRTFSEMTKKEKERYSHRAKAFRKLAEWLSGR